MNSDMNPPAEINRLIEEIEKLKDDNSELINERTKRLLTADNFQEPDRVPIVFYMPLDWWAVKSKVPYFNLINAPELQIIEQLKFQIYHFQNIMDDFIFSPARETGIDVGTENVEASLLGCRIHYPLNDHPWLDLTFAPLSTDEARKNFKVPEEELVNLGVMPKIKKFVDIMKSNGFSVIGSCGGEGPFEMACFAVGTPEFMIMLKDDPEFAREIMEKMTLLWIRQKKVFEKWFNKFSLGFGENNIGMISPEQYGEFVFPYHQKIIKSFSDYTPGFHTDACMDNILDYIIDYGINIIEINELTNLKLAKEKFYRHRIVCFGNLPQYLLCSNNSALIEAAVRKCIEDAAAGGGYYLSPNSILWDAKEENFKLIINTVERYGKY